MTAATAIDPSEPPAWGYQWRHLLTGGLLRYSGSSLAHPGRMILRARMPAEPAGPQLCRRVGQRSIPSDSSQ
jgi:hypothetical protein